MQIFNKVLLSILFLSILSCLNSQEIDNFLTSQHLDGNLNGNVLVVKNGVALYQKSFGYTDGTKNTQLTNEHRFGIGSIYKEFPATAIMQLEEKGLLKLEDKISMYIPELPDWTSQISIKHLLQYSSGLPMIRWDEYFGKGQGIDDSKILNDLQAVKELEFRPDSDYLYTNNSPFLLKKIVENISKKTFSAYVNDSLFTKAAFTNTVVESQYPYKNKTELASPFNSDFEEDQYELSVSGMLFTTTTQDIANWIRKLNSYEIISEMSLEILSQKANGISENESPLGQAYWEDGKLRKHYHHGSMGNYEGIVTYYKGEDLVIVILTNQKNKNVMELSNKIHELVNK